MPLTFDRAGAEALCTLPDDMEWDAEAAQRGDDTPSSDYVDGWNDAIRANAAPLAAQLRAALAEIDRLRSLNGDWAEAASVEQRRADCLRAEVDRLTALINTSADPDALGG